MPHHICRTCGTEHEDSPRPPALCRICSDERRKGEKDCPGARAHPSLSC